MKSSYPSSQSFFDCTSDSICADDFEKLRSSPSFSTLADLFTNRSRKSDLFPNVRASVSVPEEICFPAKKKRECEERASIWHEWGSGECQGEHVALESYGFSSEHLVGKSSVPSKSCFPNLGSASVSVVAEGFTFPTRKEREEGSSWREERTWGKDWSTTVAPKESKGTESSPIVGSITADMILSKACTKLFDAFASSKSSPLASLGTPMKSACEDVSFPARKKREERSFWQESALDSCKSDCEVKPRPRESTSGSGSLADMYSRKAGSKCSNLFSNGAVGSSEEVVFPKRKNRADRNVERDWSNTGYGDCEDETDHDYWIDNSSCSTSLVAQEVDNLDFPCSSTPSIEGLNRISGKFSEAENSENLQVSGSFLKWSGHETDGDVAHSMEALRQASQGRGCELVSGLTKSAAGNVVESGVPLLESRADRCSESTSSREEWTMNGAESCGTVEDIQSVVDFVQETTFSGSRSEQRSARNYKYPPPLRSLSRQRSSGIPSHMPWVQLERIRSDGRFVLQEGKTTQPVVFQPIRKEGRLVLQLIGQETKKDDARQTFDKRSLVADEKPTPVSGKRDSNDPAMMKTDVEVVQEKAEVKLSIVDSALEESKQNSKVGPAFGALVKKGERESAKVWPIADWPIFCTPRELLPGEEVIFARAEEAAGGMWDRKFNLLDKCYTSEEIIQSPDRQVPEQDTPATGEGPPIQDRPPPWLLGKVATEDRRLDSKRVLQSVNGIPRLAQTGNIITIHGARDTAPIRVHFQALPRSSSLRNGLAGLNSRVEGEGGVTRSRSIKSSSLTDGSTSTSSRKEEARGRPADARISVCQGIIRDSVMCLAATQFFGKPVRTRPDIPGEPHSRLSNYRQLVPVSLAFSCADGMGKRHHEKNFWEQQACVSIST